MQEAPKKNIDPVLVDVKIPSFNYKRLGDEPTVDLGYLRAVKKPRAFKKFLWIVAIILAFNLTLVSVATFFGLRGAKDLAKEKGEKIAHNLVASAQSLKDLEPEKATAALRDNANELQEVDSFLDKPYNEIILGSLSDAFPALKDVFNLVQRVSEFNINFLSLTENLLDLQSNGFSYFQKNGSALLRNLSDSKSLIAKITDQAANIRNAATHLEGTSPFFKQFNDTLDTHYLKYVSDINIWNDALANIIDILDTKIDRHFLLIFHNPSEMRPAGGFIGSYGDLVVNGGQMTNLEVQDIYWPDHKMNLDLKVVPPEPLQRITTDWGARDANWFFDFPTSARTVIGFLEASKVYKQNNVTFDGAIAINVNVLGSILEAIGPIPIEEYNLVIDKDTFLAELQREVETGRDHKPGSNPKKILSVATPKIIERLNQLPEEKKKPLLERLFQHIEEKDVMIFMKDEKLASILSTRGIDGSVYNLPNNFWGSYLAVVNANINGGKSDAFMEESVSGRIDISRDGSSFIDLSVTRTHSGGNEIDWWYNVDNRDYIQIFTNPNSSIVSVQGNSERNLLEKENYKELGYETHPDLEKIESVKTYLSDLHTWITKAFGKTVFATWFITPAGETKTLDLRYQIPGDVNTINLTSKPYQFVYERQSGVKSKVRIVIIAPVGYIWQESNDAMFIFEKDNPKAREIINLHLEKLN